MSAVVVADRPVSFGSELETFSERPAKVRPELYWPEPPDDSYTDFVKKFLADLRSSDRRHFLNQSLSEQLNDLRSHYAERSDRNSLSSLIAYQRLEAFEKSLVTSGYSWDHFPTPPGGEEYLGQTTWERFLRGLRAPLSRFTGVKPEEIDLSPIENESHQKEIVTVGTIGRMVVLQCIPLPEDVGHDFAYMKLYSPDNFTEDSVA